MNPPPMTPLRRLIMPTFAALCASLVVYGAFAAVQARQDAISYTALRRLIEEGEIVSAQIPVYGTSVHGVLKDGTKFRAVVAESAHIADRLVDAGIETSFVLPSEDLESGITPVWRDIAMDLIPFLIFLAFVGFVVYAMKISQRKINQKTEEFYARLEKIMASSKK